MTQQSQNEFDCSLENAVAWMKAIQERLQINDNTKGPRSALEARLRETEMICHLEPEGRMRMDRVLKSADTFLGSCSEDQKPLVLSKLKGIKTLWEDTVVYITHCHSRIEWVWLHWSEYLRAQDEFYRWFQSMRATLEPALELQLGWKEKQWQLSHSEVLLGNVQNQAVLLDRLLEEAASLFNRIGDPSVDEDVQRKMKAEYEEIKAKAQDRVKLLEKITCEHKEYTEKVDAFQGWLVGVTERVSGRLGRANQSTLDNQLRDLQDIAKDFLRGEESLKNLERQSEGVIQNTSPLGAEKITRELEELRKALEKLKLLCKEEEERLLKALKLDGAYRSQAQLLGTEVAEFQQEIQRLAKGLEPGEKARNEEELITLWRKYTVTRSALVAEEAKAEKLKAQLKELIQFSQDGQPLSANAVSALQDFQSLKGKTAKLLTSAGMELAQSFQRLLRDFQLWKTEAQGLVNITASVPDHSLIPTFLPQLEAALSESSDLKEKLTAVLLKKDLLSGIFGEERAKSLMAEVTDATKDRDLLHYGLLQRKSKLLNMLSQQKDFDAAFEPLQERLAALRIRVTAEKEPQSDLRGKQAQLQKLQRLHEDLLELEVQMDDLKLLVQSEPSHQHKMSQLSSDYLTLKRSLEMMLQQSQQCVEEHCLFSNVLLELQQWIMVVKEKLESYQGDNDRWKVETRAGEIERLSAEFPNREVQLHLVEAHGQRVMEKSSPGGVALIQKELKQLTESWNSLRVLEDMLSGLVRSWQLKRANADSGKKKGMTNHIPKPGSSRHAGNAVDGHYGWKELGVGEGDFTSSLEKFKQWLLVEDAKLAGIIEVKVSTPEDVKARKSKLKELQSRIPEGQDHFENLLHLWSTKGNSEDLEDVRYRWMVYKSKITDSIHLLNHNSLEGPAGFRKSRSGGLCTFLERVCRVALPLQLLLLLLLLLLFLLPLAEETHSCTLSNNFARSFNLMLHYNGPPPT
ncbi:nesprin-3 [Tachyglossus aculeatus]|uniref:nesprin-3 n=1 Tax=Tachyglossus aculeatus TaxID=9261 RepID=UPI0018F7218C|nr:nesprin-3 [Tachyglossus aculeatus]